MHILSLLALCLAAVSAVPTAPRHHQRIVGGTVTTIENWPENAAVLFNWSGTAFPQFCGSFIITNRSVVTAAHCFYYSNDPARFRHRFGSTFANSGGVVHNTNQIIIHPNYNAETEDCDIAIMRFTGTITFNNAIQPASIPSSTYNLGDNEVVWATGWGATASNGPSSEQLREVQVWTVNQATCRIRYALIGDTVTDNMLCSGWLNVGGRDQCQGDSGGPLYHNRVAVGVCSWGRGCAMAFFPGVNARVSRFTSWIQSNA